MCLGPLAGCTTYLRQQSDVAKQVIMLVCNYNHAVDRDVPHDKKVSSRQSPAYLIRDLADRQVGKLFVARAH